MAYLSGYHNIWVFSEERSGSSWLGKEIATRFGKEHRGVDVFEEDSSLIHQTHEFEFLELITNPIVIHTTRRDLYQHFLSYAFFVQRKKDGWLRCHIADDYNAQNFQHILTLPPFRVTKDQFDEWMMWKKLRKQQLDAYQGIKQTVYYEDLFDGIHIEQLGMSFAFKDGGAFRKLPYLKEDHIVNFHEIKGWINTKNTGEFL